MVSNIKLSKKKNIWVIDAAWRIFHSQGLELVLEQESFVGSGMLQASRCIRKPNACTSLTFSDCNILYGNININVFICYLFKVLTKLLKKSSKHRFFFFLVHLVHNYHSSYCLERYIIGHGEKKEKKWSLRS